MDGINREYDFIIPLVKVSVCFYSNEWYHLRSVEPGHMSYVNFSSFQFENTIRQKFLIWNLHSYLHFVPQSFQSNSFRFWISIDTIFYLNDWCIVFGLAIEIFEFRSSLLHYENDHHYLNITNFKYQDKNWPWLFVSLSNHEPSRRFFFPRSKVIYCARIEDIRLQSAQQHHLSTNRTTCAGNKNRETVTMFHLKKIQNDERSAKLNYYVYKTLNQSK